MYRTLMLMYACNLLEIYNKEGFTVKSTQLNNLWVVTPALGFSELSQTLPSIIPLTIPPGFIETTEQPQKSVCGFLTKANELWGDSE